MTADCSVWVGNCEMWELMLACNVVCSKFSPLICYSNIFWCAVWFPLITAPQSLNSFLFVCFFSFLAFVKGSGKDKYPRLQVRYKKGASPTLKLLDDTNTVQDTLAWVCGNNLFPSCVIYWVQCWSYLIWNRRDHFSGRKFPLVSLPWQLKIPLEALGLAVSAPTSHIIVIVHALGRKFLYCRNHLVILKTCQCCKAQWAYVYLVFSLVVIVLMSPLQ